MTIPEPVIDRAAKILAEHLKSYSPDGTGLELVGGEKWWRLRGRELEAEWVEVRRGPMAGRAQRG